jgi:ketopantoate reductase
MTQKELTVVVDAFSAAIARVAEHAPTDVIEQMHQATGDLLEALSTAATNMAAHEVLVVLRKITAVQTELEKIRTQHREDEAAQAHVNMMHVDLAVGAATRIDALEKRTERRHEDAPHDEERRAGE